MTESDSGYTAEDRDHDMDTVRRTSRRLATLRKKVNETSAERLVALRRLRNLGGATYPELAKAMGTTYSAVQRLLEKLDRDKDN
ncbi:helix-turn-helix domain-containing protein [Mycobacteroides abscessus]|uniref:helix-turn-helix domain-containing protein n=1 Tax=Mycobacteroides abscessus TaxID=36809 RepID=UPI001040B986|nr:helix-turn-helix domain-containing protein [Mycobacteroides abscessus]